ncbi:MAG TPA: glutamate--tRNA ligase family protein [Vicinamibacterales bacterium]|nr:glutamate--tRNA ligase family protein [Vicinamibacterales bacterium]
MESAGVAVESLKRRFDYHGLSALVIRPDLRRASALCGATPITRYAPSPTGYLHLGHVVNAIYVWGLAGALGGSVVLRVEDHDRVRSRDEFERAILEDLDWLGFLRTDTRRTRQGVDRQSEHDDVYALALDRLRARFHVYSCDCSRTDIGGECYTGRCRDRRVPERPGTGLRLQLADGTEHFDDLLLGPQAQSPADQCGDLLVRDRHGQWTYQFAVTIDDLRQRITLVARGADLLSSTGRQLRLARMLVEAGASPRRPTPCYLHHPLIFGDDGLKLSKSTGSAGVRAMRQQGLSPPEVIGEAAAAVGLIARPRPVSAADVESLFTGAFEDEEGLRTR